VSWAAPVVALHLVSGARHSFSTCTLAGAIGSTVACESIACGADGYYRPKTKAIVVELAYSPNRRVKTRAGARACAPNERTAALIDRLSRRIEDSVPTVTLDDSGDTRGPRLWQLSVATRPPAPGWPWRRGRRERSRRPRERPTDQPEETNE
jgi:hypothetical protein